MPECHHVASCPFRDACPDGCRAFAEPPEPGEARVIPLASQPEALETVPKEAETVLEEANRLIYGDRQSEYGPGHVEMEMVGRMWSVILGCDVSGYQAALCMSALKLVRATNAYKRDNLVDGAGYLGLAQRVVEGR